MNIDITYHADIPRIKRYEKGDWVDLRAAEDVFVRKGEYVQISLGVSMRLPEGYEAIVAPRSSTFKNYGIIMVNGIGIIDNSYSGTNDIWRFPAYCLDPKEKTENPDWRFKREAAIVEGSAVHKGDRICQFRIQKVQPVLEFIERERLGDSDRGGLGSTGVR